jgi:hypothetical protein
LSPGTLQVTTPETPNKLEQVIHETIENRYRQ